MSATAKTPPKQKARKANPINEEFESKAKELLRYAMKQQNVSVEELAERLERMGVKISSGGLANKISRGSFPASFLLQCAEALETSIVPVVLTGRDQP